MILPILLLVCKNRGKMSGVLVYAEIVLNMCRVLVYAKKQVCTGISSFDLVASVCHAS